MHPKHSKYLKILTPLSIFSLAAGLQLILILVAPGLYPGAHERMVQKHLTAGVATLGLICVLLPVSLLYWITKLDTDER